MTVTPDVYIIDINSRGMINVYSKLSIKWWQWILSIPKSTNPANDMSGELANINQNEKGIFFLAQTLESTKTIPQRLVNIPKGSNIFMPILNWISVRDNGNQTNKELIDFAKERMDQIGSLSVKLNNKSILKDFEKFRIKSQIFESNLPSRNILDMDPGPCTMVSDGYWILLKPVMKKFNISTFGSCSAGLTKIGVNYSIRVI